MQKDKFFTAVTKDKFVISYDSVHVLTVHLLEQKHEPKKQVLANIQKAQGIIKSLMSGRSKYGEAQKIVNYLVTKDKIINIAKQTFN